MRIKTYLWSVVAVAIAVLLRLLFLQVLGQDHAFVTFYPAVAAAAFMGGFGPGFLASVMSVIAAHYFWMDPSGKHWLETTEIVSILIFLSGGILISYMAFVMERTKKRQIAAETAAGLAQANLEVKEGEDRFSILSAVTLEGVALSEGGIIIDANDQLCRMLGYEKEELIGRHIDKFSIDAEDRETVENKILKGDEVLGEYRVTRKDGSTLFVEAHGRNSIYRSGALRITSVRDITRRKQLEQELREDREKLALFVEHAPAALAMFDREMRYIFASRKWIKNLHLSHQELKGLSHYEIVPEVKGEWKEAHRRGLAGEVVSATDDPFRRPDGTMMWVNWEVHPWRQADGSIGGIIIFSEDITERKQDEERLKELTQRLTYHIENSPLAVIEWGADMRLIRWAGAAERIFGWEREEVIGKRIEDLHWVYDDDQAQVAEVTGDLASGGNATRFSANRNFRKDGSVAFCEWYNSSLLDDSGHLRSILSLVLDVTERKRLEEALQKHAETLETTVRERTAEVMEKNQLLLHQSRLAAMGEMLNTIAHQWRQPLNVLGLHIQNVAELYDLRSQEEIDKYIEKCMKLIQHMSDTINDFRDFFRPEKEKAEFCINSSIQKAVDLVASGFKQNNITIATALTNGATVNGYPNQFAQAILCMLQNARDAIIERGIKEGVVTISSSVAGDNMVFTVSDNAGGIPEEIKCKIFEPYFSTKGVAGTGIGLYMTKTIIENMGGNISVRNSKDGAEFRVEVGVNRH